MINIETCNILSLFVYSLNIDWHLAQRVIKTSIFIILEQELQKIEQQTKQLVYWPIQRIYPEIDFQQATQLFINNQFMKEKSKKIKTSSTSTFHSSRNTHRIKKRIIQIKKKLFRNSLSSILHPTSSPTSPNSSYFYSNNQSAYLVTLYFTKYYNELSQYNDYHAFLCGLTIINELRSWYSQLQCHLLGCTIYAIISKIFSRRQFKVFKAMQAISPFTSSHLEAAESQILRYLNFTIPHICIQQPEQIKFLIEREERKIRKGVEQKFSNNLVPHSS